MVWGDNSIGDQLARISWTIYEVKEESEETLFHADIAVYDYKTCDNAEYMTPEDVCKLIYTLNDYGNRLYPWDVYYKLFGRLVQIYFDYVNERSITCQEQN
jgi:hypothetical protein